MGILSAQKRWLKYGIVNHRKSHNGAEKEKFQEQNKTEKEVLGEYPLMH